MNNTPATYFLTAVMMALSGKCCPRSPSFIGQNRWKSEGAKSGLYGGCDRAVWPNFATGIIVLQEKSFLLLWPHSGNSGLQLSIMVRVDSSRKSKRITPFLSQKAVYITLPSDGCILKFLVGNSHVTTSWVVILDTMSRHRWWCIAGNCRLHLCSGSAYLDVLAFGGLYVPVRASVGPKLCDIPTLLASFQMHLIRHSALYKVPWL